MWRRRSLPPYNSHVRIILDDLIEGRQVDAREAADLVRAVVAGEQPPDGSRVRETREAVLPGRGVPDIHGESGNVQENI